MSMNLQNLPDPEDKIFGLRFQRKGVIYVQQSFLRFQNQFIPGPEQTRLELVAINQYGIETILATFIPSPVNPPDYQIFWIPNEAVVDKDGAYVFDEGTMIGTRFANEAEQGLVTSHLILDVDNG